MKRRRWLIGLVGGCVAGLPTAAWAASATQPTAGQAATRPAVGAGTVTTRPTSGPAARPPLVIELGKGVTMKLAPIPAGKFLMGSPAGEAGRNANEGPRHEVVISKPFYMGVYEVTQAQYEAVMDANPSLFKGPDKPVDGVSWEDAVEFCKRASAKSGKAVSLPTEAQWEYACRAGTTTRYNFGDDEARLGEYAWFGQWGPGGQGQAIKVGQRKPNGWGLYDMHGNVSEWCRDGYAEDYAAAGKTDPLTPKTGAFCVVRGGNWGTFAYLCRSASRVKAPALGSYTYLGFRVVAER